MKGAEHLKPQLVLEYSDAGASAVPEPRSVLLFLPVLAVLGVLKRRRRV